MMRVLEVFREPLANGGQESFIMNMYRNMDHDQIVMDFLTPFTCDNPALKAEIESYGGQVYTYDYPFGSRENQVFKESLKDFFKDHTYPVVHFHSGSTYALMEGPKLAKQAGIPVRIVHSHCTGFDNLKYRVIKALSVPSFHRYPTHFAACSLLAAKWKFPKDIVENQKVTILKNAVDLDRFCYDENRRQTIRRSYQVENKTVLGHVGRFSLQKNHDFLIDIFQNWHARHPQSELWLIGSGELEEPIKEKVHKAGLDEAVRFFGLRKDIPDLMNAMDVFVLPSLFEGLPVVGVEAQAAGLPVVTSDQVTRELPLPALSAYVPLGQENLEKWSQAIETAAALPRKEQRLAMQQAGYDVKQAAKAMQDLYLEAAGK